ncbi:MAG TPA: hypothetical protein VMV10_11060 [Pirellulales bacterium]|nr:hypothetical protein [Pirellulales bacterium]
MSQKIPPDLPLCVAKLRVETAGLPLNIDLLLDSERNASTVDNRAELFAGVQGCHLGLLLLFHSSIENESGGLITKEWLRSVVALTGRAIGPCRRLADPQLDSAPLENDKTELRAIRGELDEIEWAGRDATAVSDLRPATTSEPPELTPDARRSIDCRSVAWYGARYTFTAAQAACVAVWWQHWAQATPDVSDNALAEHVEINSSLRKLFSGHPAWGVMIVEGATRGAHRLQPPAN